MRTMTLHVANRMGECLRDQQVGVACAPCPACQLVRDGLVAMFPLGFAVRVEAYDPPLGLAQQLTPKPPPEPSEK